MTQESITAKTLNSTIWTATEKIASLGVGFVVSMVLARLLNPSDFGVIALLAVFFSIAESFSSCGFSNALIRKKNCTQADYSTAFLYNICVSFVTYVVVFFTAPYVALFYNNEILCPVMRVSGLSLIINSVNLTQSVQLTRNLNFKYFAICTLITSIVSGMVGIIAAIMGYGVWALVIYGLTSSFIGTVVIILAARWKPTLEISKESFKYLWGFGSKMLVTGIISTIYSNIYPVVIGKFYNTQVLGLFNRGQSISQLGPNIINGIFTKTTLPILAPLQSNKERLLTVYRKMVVVTSALTFPMCALAVVLAKPFVLFFLTEKWLDSVIYIQIFSISAIFTGANSINLNLFQVEGRSDITLKLEIIKKTIGLVVVGGLLFLGPIVLAIGSSFFNVFAYAINLFYVNKIEKLPYLQQLRDMCPCFIASLISALFAYLITLMNISACYQLILGICLGLGVYFFITIYIQKVEFYSQIVYLIKNKLRNEK